MDNMEKMIRDALEDCDDAALKNIEEQSYFELGLSQFRGKMGWVTWVIMVVQAVLFLGGVYCAVNFFAATDVLLALKWGLPSVALMVMATNLKLSLAPQMQADRVIHEMRRLELLFLSKGA